jgi:hypothetical protein
MAVKAGTLACYWGLLRRLTAHIDLFVPGLRVKHFHGLKDSSVRATSPLLHKQSLSLWLTTESDFHRFLWATRPCTTLSSNPASLQVCPSLHLCTNAYILKSSFALLW